MEPKNAYRIFIGKLKEDICSLFSPCFLFSPMVYVPDTKPHGIIPQKINDRTIFKLITQAEVFKMD